MTQPSRVLLALSVLLASFAHPSAAQERTARPTGKVLDPSGAAIARATVTIRRDAAGFARTVVADNEGAFQVGDVPPGEYAVTATSDGFTLASERVVVQS